MIEKDPPASQGASFWIRHVLLIAASCFFLFFGIQVLVSAYQLDDPFAFILTFFASNFIILISGALMVGFIWKIKTVVTTSQNMPDSEDE